MARYAGLSRRDFLKLTGAGGGLLLGLHLPTRAGAATGAEAADEAAGDEAFEPNAWIRIGTDGSILFLVARSEMGQGVMTALPMLIAEELGVGLDQISIRFAPASPEYTNQLIGQQLTGGSTSVRDAWTKLREAGAVARTMLVEAAAQRWLVDAGDCRVERAQVLHPDGTQRLGFGALAEQAASMPVPPGVFLKEPDEWTLIGTPAPRLDTPRKVNGQARYGIDVRLTDMVRASVERCPVFGGTPRAFDASAALKVPGVIAVVPISGGVAVVAEDTWTALRARQQLDVDWELGPDAEVSSPSIRARFERELDREGIPVRTVCTGTAGSHTWSSSTRAPSLRPRNTAILADASEPAVKSTGASMVRIGSMSSVRGCIHRAAQANDDSASALRRGGCRSRRQREWSGRPQVRKIPRGE